MRRKRDKKSALIVRLAPRLGPRPGRGISEVLEWIEVLAIGGFLVSSLVMGFVTVLMHVPDRLDDPGDRSVGLVLRRWHLASLP
jgi:hypothetical protein